MNRKTKNGHSTANGVSIGAMPLAPAIEPSLERKTPQDESLGQQRMIGVALGVGCLALAAWMLRLRKRS